MEITAGRTTGLPFTIWSPLLDTAHQITIASPTTDRDRCHDPTMPGLELHLPAGTVIRDEDGAVVKTLRMTQHDRQVMKLRFDIVSEPVDEMYRQLLAHCAKYSSNVLLVVREPNWMATSAQDVLENLKPYEVSKVRQSECPGTVLLSDTADVYKFRLTSQVLERIQTAATRLYDWVQPDLPEDLCVIRPDGSPVLVTIAHERDAYLVMTEKEAEELATAIPELKFERRQ